MSHKRFPDIAYLLQTKGNFVVLTAPPRLGGSAIATPRNTVKANGLVVASGASLQPDRDVACPTNAPGQTAPGLRVNVKAESPDLVFNLTH
jgi:hypothetical protein